MARTLNTVFQRGSPASQALKLWRDLDSYDRIQILRAYYDNNDLHTIVDTKMEGDARHVQKLQAIRNPTRQVVEFHVMFLFSGPLADALPLVMKAEVPASVPKATGELVLSEENLPPVMATNGPPPEPPDPAAEQTVEVEDPRITAIEQVWEWSNLAQKLKLYVRSTGRDGDIFIKITGNGTEFEKATQVYWQLLDAADVVEFDRDHRDFITWIRIDTPQAVRDDKGKITIQWQVEVWNKASQLLTIWRHDKGRAYDLEKLSSPSEIHDFSEYGVDYVPIVWGPFLDTGHERGEAAIEGSLDKIDEADRLATRLHRLLGSRNDVLWALQSNMVDSQGRPVPAPAIAEGEDGGEVLEVGGERMVKLPGMSTMTPLVPNINYDAALSVLQAHVKAMEGDLPELAYERLGDMGDLSGRAIQLHLGKAIARAQEARSNMEAAFVRADQIALSIGQFLRLPGFTQAEIGTFKDGDFDHTFGEREVIPIPDSEKAETFSKMTGGAALSPSPVLKLLGFSDEFIQTTEAEREADEVRRQQTFAQGLMQAQQNVDAARSRTQQNGNGFPPSTS